MAIVSLPHEPMVGFKRNALFIVRGMFNEFDVTAQNDDGSALDLTGRSVYMVAYRHREIVEDDLHYVNPVLKQDSNGAFIAITEPAAGKIKLLLVGSLTEAIDPDMYWYDLWYVKADGQKVMLIDKAEFKVHE